MERASLILQIDGETVREICLPDEETAKRIYNKMLELYRFIEREKIAREKK